MSNHGDFKSQVLQATDIVELIGQSVALKRGGKDYVGLCPFHQEKSPSFHVSPTKQFYHCFGCREHGNAIDFVMKRDRIEFIEALKLLGERAGLEMPKYGGGNKQKSGERQMLLDAHSAACSFFQQTLAHPEIGKPAREYLEKRGFTAESVKQFQIGLAPASWDGLMRSPLMKKFTPQELHLGGLVKARDNNSGFYDTFRNRLMFPIRDEVGRIIAFGGRVMPGSQDPAKYLNSPETPLFSKSRCAFGLDLGKKRIAESRTVCVVEGYTDVIMAHQFGVSNVVSILGTAMTEQHVSLLKRFADRIVLLFDADAAGDNAADKTVSLFLTQDIEIAIASMPEGLDPDEFLLGHGAGAFEKVMASATDALTFKWQQLSTRFQTGDLTGQQKAVEAYIQTLAGARAAGKVNNLRWGPALARVSKLTGMPTEELYKQFRSNAAAPPRAPMAPRPAPNAATPGPTPLPPPLGRKRVLSARDRAERWILGCLLIEPGRWTQVQQHVHLEDFTDPAVHQLAELYWTHQRDEGEPVFNEFLGYLQDPALTELAVELVEAVEAFPDLRVSLEGAIEGLAREKERLQQQKLVAELRRKGVVDPMQGASEVDLLQQLQNMKKAQPNPSGPSR